jgi:hypothetical protein
VLEGLYISRSDELSEERLRVLLGGPQGDEEAGGGEARLALLWQVQACFRKAQHWHVLWRLRHIARIVSGSPVGQDLLTWLRLVMLERGSSRGHIYASWHEVFSWVVQQQSNAANRDWAAMAADIVRDLLQPLYGTGLGRGG